MHMAFVYLERGLLISNTTTKDAVKLDMKVHTYKPRTGELEARVPDKFGLLVLVF